MDKTFKLLELVFILRHIYVATILDERFSRAHATPSEKKSTQIYAGLERGLLQE
jgi:hypothetical protein